MIQSRAELRRILKSEKSLYKKNGARKQIVDYLTSEPNIIIWKYQRLLRITEYCYNNRSNPIYHFLYLIYRRRKNRRGLRLGIEIWENSFDEGLIIYHAGNIVVNGTARIGKNCKLHGANCIGNSGDANDAPTVGDNVDIGTGACIIGDIQLGNNIRIGAGAVVVKSFKEDGVTLVGVPASVIRRK